MFVNGVGQGAPGGGIGGAANRIFLTIWDGGGFDTYDMSNYSNGLTINLTPGTWSVTSDTQRAYLGNGHFAQGTVYNAMQFNGDPASLIENAIGGSGNDTIIGNSANNTIDGGPGTDTAVYSGIRSQYQITLNQSGVFHIFDMRSGTPDGVDDVSNVEWFQFADGTVGASNLLSAVAGKLAPVQESGNFNGDTDANGDVLWRHDTGQVYIWEMDGLQTKAEGTIVHAAVPNDWHIQGIGDFDGDLDSDLVWRHDSGTVYFWEMNGLQVKTEGTIVHAAVPNDWHIQGVGDFDGDGKSDLVWRHDSGTVYFWEMNGLQVKTEGTILHAAVPNDWHVNGVGDFDGDGKDDILWRHDSGQVYIWEMNGLQVKAEGAVAHAAVPNDWQVQAIGDYDADGKSDILWRHDSGQVYIWEMNGLQVKNEGAVAHAPVPNDWHIVA
jgi:serralysin